MTYAGDSALSEDIRKRVEETFKQSRVLALEGKTQEATLGCEFVLRLDSLYEPARELLNRIELGDLSDHPAAAEGDPALSLNDPEKVTVGASGASALDFDLQAEMTDLLEKRDFRTLLSLAEEHKDVVTADPELAARVLEATGRLESEPYVRTFIDSAEAAHRTGKPEEAQALLEKARTLDPSHPSLPAPVMAAEFDESNERIRELLEEGQRALERNDHQGAIDSWSRIFLIDIDHAEASKRIEGARRLKAETERQLEEAFHEGVSQWELGGTDKAREQFEKVLGLSPTHPGAKEYIARMDARAAEPEPADLGARPSGDNEILTPSDSLPFAVGEAAEGQQSPLNDPPTGAEGAFDSLAAGEEPEPPPVPQSRRGGSLGNRRFMTMAGIGVLALLAVFAALYWKRDSFFPNSEPVPAAAQIDVLARAQKLQAAGDSARAIAQLSRLPTEHPQYAEAQALIAQWETPAVVEEPTGPSAEQLAARDALAAEAHAAKDNRQYLVASRLYDEAAKSAPLEDQDRLLSEEVRQRLADIELQIDLFEQGDWEFVLPDLWRMRSANPDDKDVVKLMVDSYFNLGVRDLQRGDTPAATEKFTRAQELDPGDSEVERLLRFSQVYGERPADLLYRIFVKYLPFR